MPECYGKWNFEIQAHVSWHFSAFAENDTTASSSFQTSFHLLMSICIDRTLKCQGKEIGKQDWKKSFMPKCEFIRKMLLLLTLLIFQSVANCNGNFVHLKFGNFWITSLLRLFKEMRILYPFTAGGSHTLKSRAFIVATKWA